MVEMTDEAVAALTPHLAALATAEGFPMHLRSAEIRGGRTGLRRQALRNERHLAMKGDDCRYLATLRFSGCRRGCHRPPCPGHAVPRLESQLCHARAYRQIWRIPMAKGQKKSNRETKKPKKDKAVATVQTSIIPTSDRLVRPKTSGRVSG